MPISEAEVAAYWNANAARWSDHTRRGLDWARTEINNPAFFSLVGDIGGLDILDAGCGDGFNTRLFAQRGAKLTGVDISDAMLATAREEEARNSLGIVYHKLSFSNLTQLADSSFDAVLSTMALMDAPDLEGALAEFARVTRPGGFLAFNILHPCFMTRGFQWIRDADGRRSGLVVAGYFDVASDWIDRWHFGGAGADVEDFAIPRFHRTVSDYVNALAAAAYTIERMLEPRPSEEFCRKYDVRHWRDHASNFLQFRARRLAR